MLNDLLVIGDTSRAVARSLPALRVRGQYFEQVDGTRMFMAEAIDFSDYGLWLDGHDQERVAKQRATIGFNCRRVGTRATNWFNCTSLARHPEFYDRIPEYVAMNASLGMYVGWIVYIGADQDYDPEHWHRMGEAAKRCDTSCFLSAVIEHSNQHGSAVIDMSQFSKIDGVICSRGSNGSSWTGTVFPPMPNMDFFEEHWNISSEWQRKCGHDTSKDARSFKAPGWVTEIPSPEKENPSGYPGYDTREAQIARYRSAGQGSALEIAGCSFNCLEGKWSTLYKDSLDHAVAFIEGARSINLKIQDGLEATHRYDLDMGSGGQWLRVYQKQDQFAYISK